MMTDRDSAQGRGPQGDIVEVPAYSESGGGDTAVFLLHGVGGGKDVWPWQLDALAAGGYHAIAWDMPGYGDSAPVSPYTLPALARSLARLLDCIGARWSILVGHSMGGMVAQELLVAASGRVQGVVLSATSPAFGRPDGAWQRRFLADRLTPLDEGRTMAELAPKIVQDLVGPDADPEGLRLAEAAMSRVSAATYRAALHALMGFDRRDRLASIRIPALVLAGALDSNAPPQMMQRMAEKIPGARYECLPGVGHLASMEQPQRFNEAVLAFLDECVPRSAVSGIR